jgi:hypothetical protein
MITFIRTISIAPGKTRKAMAFGHDIARYIKEKHGTTIEVLMPMGGNPSRIAWFARFDGLAQLETLTGKLLAEGQYMELVEKNADTFLAGSLHDEIWRAI